MNANEIISIYEKTGSLNETAKICGVNWQKVRKILITERKYECDLSISIGNLLAEGKSVSEISAILNISTKAVNSYLPYNKCIYNLDEPTINAVRIKKHRDKNIDKLIQ